MARLKIKEGGIQAKVNIPDSVLEKAQNHIDAIAEPTPIEESINISELDDKIDEVRLNQISYESESLKNFDDLESKMEKISSDVSKITSRFSKEFKFLENKVNDFSVPIVKEIKIDKTGQDDLEHLEINISRTVSKLNAERVDDHRKLVKMILAGNRLQSAINFLLITGIMLLAYIK